MSNTSFGVGLNIDRPPTYEEFEQFRGTIQLDYRATGRDLFNEVIEHRGGVYLEKDSQGILHRYACSSRGCLVDFSRGVCYIEVAKARYGGLVIPQEKKDSVSETCKMIRRGVMESYEDALVRCFGEEMRDIFKTLGYEPQKLDMRPFEGTRPQIDTHPSSLWANTISHVRYRRFLFFLDFTVDPGRPLPEIFGKRFIINKDYDGDAAQDETKCVQCYLRADPIEKILSPKARRFFESFATKESRHLI